MHSIQHVFQVVPLYCIISSFKERSLECLLNMWSRISSPTMTIISIIEWYLTKAPWCYKIIDGITILILFTTALWIMLHRSIRQKWVGVIWVFFLKNQNYIIEIKKLAMEIWPVNILWTNLSTSYFDCFPMVLEKSRLENICSRWLPCCHLTDRFLNFCVSKISFPNIFVFLIQHRDRYITHQVSINVFIGEKLLKVFNQ